MPVEENIRFIFTSASQPDDTFTVAEFHGTEAISKLYEFDITLYADDPDINLKEVLKNPVKLRIEKNGEELRVFHGILSRFEQLHEYSGHIYFRAILVPRLWISDQYRENQLFLDKSIPDIIEEVLKQTGLTTNDYELKLTGNYAPWEYICQYNESDFNFISRWMEREGIYYYFQQGDDAEKLIIADASTAHEDIPSGESIRYSPPDSLSPSTIEQVREFTCHQHPLPKKVILKDYNYRKPSLDLKGEADVDSEGRGHVYIYGEHFKTPEEGNALARIRAEEILCREAIFYGEGTVPPFLTGYIFEMHDHYRDSYNQRYLITELSHQGVQSTYLTGTGDTVAETDMQGPSYFNNFSCIPADAQFRPERLAEKPKLKGTLNGTVDAGGDGEYAEIDDEGRYKIKLPFDQSDSADGKASRWVRMAQPYAGADYGMHFPLHKGTEVLLTFIDGDPDRPIISGTVPNPETGSPVTGANQTQSMIRTAGGNQIRIEDSNGGQQIHMSSPTKGSIVSLGAVNAGNIYLHTDGTMVSECDENSDETVGGSKYIGIAGSENKTVGTSTFAFGAGSDKQYIYVDGNRKVEVTGEENVEINQMQNVTIGQGQNITIESGGRTDIIGGGDLINCNGDRIEIVDGVEDFSVTGNQFYSVDQNREFSVGGNDKYTVTGDRHIDVGGNHTGHSNGLTRAISSGSVQTIHFAEDYTLTIGTAMENFVGAKFVTCSAIIGEINYGLRFGKGAMDLKDGNALIQKYGAIALEKCGIKIFS